MSRYSRGGFLRRVGAGALTAGTGGLVADRASAAPAAVAPQSFGRLFKLPPFAAPTARVRDALLALGAPGGPMDAKDELQFGPAVLFIPEDYEEIAKQLGKTPNNENNPTQSSGTTFVAQFLAHDLSFDAASRLGTAAPAGAGNARSAAFDLESIYLGGPVASAHLYDPADLAKLRVESGGTYEDVPRTADATAIVGDPRNDSSVILSGLHAAFLQFHNNAVDYVRAAAPSVGALAAFERARRETRWHYQWLVVHEFLPQFVGRALVADVLKKGRRVFRSKTPFVPIEFAAAAFRFGHSIVRPSYRLNFKSMGGQPFFGFVFDPAEEGKADPGDLRGGARAPRRYVDWETFFDFGDGKVRTNKLIDTHISTPMFNLPLGAIPAHEAPTSLPQRDLLRHLTWQLPSGQAVAKKLGAPPLTPGELWEIGDVDATFARSTPLWYYILKEADVRASGLRLGPVGGRIVAEVVLGLLQLDRDSYLNARPKWTPTFGRDGEFTTTDFLTFAGVGPASRARTAA
jgi:Animal haem peroxidase